jgi:hypothetical protein
MKKIYLQPEMELTECVMLRAAVCSNTDVLNNGGSEPEITNPGDKFPAPGRKVF